MPLNKFGQPNLFSGAQKLGVCDHPKPQILDILRKSESMLACCTPNECNH